MEVQEVEEDQDEDEDEHGQEEKDINENMDATIVSCKRK